MLEVSTYTGGLVQTNCHLLHLPKGAILFDAPDGAAAWLEAEGVKPAALMLTHQHFDHVQNAAAVKEKFGCPVYAWAPFDRKLTLERFFGAVTGSLLHVPEYAVDHVLDQQAEVMVAGLTFHLLHVPGHSADSVCFYQPESGLLFDGDVVMRSSWGRTDFPGGSHNLLMEGIQTHLAPLPDATLIFPGHGPGTTIGEERLQNPAFTDTGA